MEKEILLDVQHLSIGFESYNANVERCSLMLFLI